MTDRGLGHRRRRAANWPARSCTHAWRACRWPCTATPPTAPGAKGPATGTTPPATTSHAGRRWNRPWAAISACRRSPGFAQTGLFPIYMTGPTGRCVQFRRQRRPRRPAPIASSGWRSRFDCRSARWFAAAVAQPSARGMIWYRQPGKDPAAAGLPLDKYWRHVEVGHHAEPLERSAGAVRRHPGRLEQGQPQPPRPGLVRARCPGPALGGRPGGRRLQPARLLRRQAVRLLPPAGRGAQHAGDQSRPQPRTRTRRPTAGSADSCSRNDRAWPWPT